MADEIDDERPWTEAEWAKFMKEGDVRAARYGELLETFRDDPDCHEKVAREMGWDVDDADDADEEDYDFAKETGDLDVDDRFDDALSELESALDGEEPKDEDEGEDEGADADEEATPHDKRSPFEEDPDIAVIPAYAAARDCGRTVDRILKPWMSQDESADLDERIPEVWTGIHVAAAKISGGHAMGYEDEVLCGNIVCNTIALQSVETCIKNAIELAHENILPQDSVDELLPELRSVQQIIAARVEELRQRVWW